MQARFDGFELRITRQLEGTKSLDLVRVQAELDELQKSIEELYKRKILLMPIIEEITKDPMVENIQAIDNLTHMGNFEERRKKKKYKKRKRKSTVEENIEATNIASVQDELDWQTRVQEVAAGARNSRPTDTIGISSSTAPSPNTPLSTPITT